MLCSPQPSLHNRKVLSLLCSLEPSSRASSIGSDAEARTSTSGAVDAGHAPIQPRSTGKALVIRKRKADAEIGPADEADDQPRQRRQKVAYAAYVDAKTGKFVDQPRPEELPTSRCL